MAKVYEIWMEGYNCNGASKTHEFIGRVTANSFKQACKLAVKKWCGKESFEKYYNSENQTFWGCKCYDNEIDAARHFR